MTNEEWQEMIRKNVAEHIMYYPQVSGITPTVISEKEETKKMTYEVSGIQQGWQCPICKRVYSPITTMCFYCGGECKTGINTDVTAIDWTKRQSVTTSGGTTK